MINLITNTTNMDEFIYEEELEPVDLEAYELEAINSNKKTVGAAKLYQPIQTFRGYETIKTTAKRVY